MRCIGWYSPRRLPASERAIAHDEPTTDPASLVAITGNYGEPAAPLLRENDPLAPCPLNVVIIAPRDEAGQIAKTRNRNRSHASPNDALVTFVQHVRSTSRVTNYWRLPVPEVIAAMTHHAER